MLYDTGTDTQTLGRQGNSPDRGARQNQRVKICQSTRDPRYQQFRKFPLCEQTGSPYSQR
ncbi:hypothetical protein EMIT0P74_110117 [Pseudomonas sp. IT-P74]